MIHVQKFLSGPPYDGAYTQRLIGAFDDLMGAGRYHGPEYKLGWWFISFPGHDAPPWRPPTTGWHIEGNFHHHVDSPRLGIQPIFLFSDIGPGDGGTVINVGSHKLAARALAEAGTEGLAIDELCRRVARQPFGRIVEVNGRAGDVALLHPFVSHTRSVNTGRTVRFIGSPGHSLKEPMNLNRRDAREHSPVERAIVEALAPDQDARRPR
jgi:hypothetical protein